MEKQITTKEIFNGNVLKIRLDEVELDDGRKGEREVVHHPGGAAILVVKDGKILLEKQFRYPYKEIIREIPAGKRDKGEEFIETAKRELEEETGYRAENLIKLFEIYPTPGYTDEKIAIFKAEGLEKGEKHFDEGEDIISEWIPEEEVFAMIERGEIKDAKTLVALLWYKEKRARNGA